MLGCWFVLGGKNYWVACWSSLDLCPYFLSASELCVLFSFWRLFAEQEFGFVGAPSLVCCFFIFAKTASKRLEVKPVFVWKAGWKDPL